MVYIQNAIYDRDKRANDLIIKSISKLVGADLYVRNSYGLFCPFDGPIYLEDNILYYRYFGKYQALDLSDLVIYQEEPDLKKADEVPNAWYLLTLLLMVVVKAKAGQVLDSNKISQALSRYVRDVNQYKFEVNFLTNALNITLKDSGTIIDIESFIRSSMGNN